MCVIYPHYVVLCGTNKSMDVIERNYEKRRINHYLILGNRQVWDKKGGSCVAENGIGYSQIR